MHRFALALEQVREIHAEHVDNSDARNGRRHGRERLLMRIVSVRREQNEFADARRFP